MMGRKDLISRLEWKDPIIFVMDFNIIRSEDLISQISTELEIIYLNC